ncbi:MAG: hypothetical protein ACLRIL_05705 [Fusicatenibacter saccharivorans]
MTQIVAGLKEHSCRCGQRNLEDQQTEYEDIHSFVEANLDRPDRRCRKEAAHRAKPK